MYEVRQILLNSTLYISRLDLELQDHASKVICEYVKDN